MLKLECKCGSAEQREVIVIGNQKAQVHVGENGINFKKVDKWNRNE